MRRTKRPIIFLRAQIKEMNLCWRSEHGIADGKENCTAIGLHLAFTYNYNIYIYIYRTRIEQLTILQLGFQLGYIHILYNMRYIRSTISNSHGTINHTAIILLLIIIIIIRIRAMSSSGQPEGLARTLVSLTTFICGAPPRISWKTN